jgi:hypothetical protein
MTQHLAIHLKEGGMSCHTTQRLGEKPTNVDKSGQNADKSGEIRAELGQVDTPVMSMTEPSSECKPIDFLGFSSSDTNLLDDPNYTSSCAKPLKNREKRSRVQVRAPRS